MTQHTIHWVFCGKCKKHLFELFHDTEEGLNLTECCVLPPKSTLVVKCNNCKKLIRLELIEKGDKK